MNVLPWELREAEDKLLAMLEEIRDTANPKDEKPPSSRLLPRGFPLLLRPASGRSSPTATLWDDLQRGTYKGVELQLPWVGDDEGTSQNPGERYSLKQFPALLMDELFDFTKALASFWRIRFGDCMGAPRQTTSSNVRGGSQRIISGGLEARKLVEKMGACFDLRKLAVEPCTLTGRVEALHAVHAAASAGGVVLPPLSVLEAQLERLRSRLVAGASGDYKETWFDASGAVKSGTVIMKSLYMDSDLHAGLGDIMYVFEHCALKTRNEAVVEGIGSIVNMHADGRRGLSAEAYEKEAFIHFNGPPLPKADGIIKEALDIHFEGKPWHFKKDSAEALAKFSGTQSLVLNRHKQETCKLPCMA